MIIINNDIYHKVTSTSDSHRIRRYCLCEIIVYQKHKTDYRCENNIIYILRFG